MTRTDVMASSRPSAVGAAFRGAGRSRSLRGLLSLAVGLLLALALVPGVALAAEEPTSGYKQTPTATTTTPSSGVAPVKEAEKPAKEPTPTKETAPATSATHTTTSEKATTLPFTGFDLRWDVGLGLLLVVAGLSIVVLQRRWRSSRR
jgi:hypothetical protein